jgi:sulfate adenylyltransferase subunit 1
MNSTLRIMTAGSVDDGKSTLIGRLLYDLNLITDDVLSDLRAASLRNGRGALDLSLYTDGLVAEREQGITIDVAYRYFRYQDRAYILCDAPGHVQYTRNMVCAASQADVALIMIDARSGPTEQTKRHVRVAQMLNVAHLVFVVNKLDLVDYSQERYQQVCDQLNVLAPAVVIPVSALDGENIVHPSKKIGWYVGPTLMHLLAKLSANSRFPETAALRFTIQSVMRPTGKVAEHLHDFRALAGRVESGEISVGQTVQINSCAEISNRTTTVKAIYRHGQPALSATAGDSISVVLSDDVGAARGDVIAGANEVIHASQTVEAQWCWMNDKPATIGQRILVKQATRTVQGKIIGIDAKLDLSTGQFYSTADETEPTLATNEIGQVRLQMAYPLLIDDYKTLPRTGSLLLIDPQKLDTLGAAVIAKCETSYLSKPALRAAASIPA